MTNIGLKKMNPGQIGKYARFIPRDILDEEELTFLWDRFEGIRGEIRNLSSSKNVSGVRWDDKGLLYGFPFDDFINERREKVMRKKK